MSRRARALTLAELPLYATDRELGEAILGPGRATDWEVIAQREETRGLPPHRPALWRALRSRGQSLLRPAPWPGAGDRRCEA